MEDSVQKNQIKETVNQLYALRAGLSLVDKEYDKVKYVISSRDKTTGKIQHKIDSLSIGNSNNEYIAKENQKEKKKKVTEYLNDCQKIEARKAEDENLHKNKLEKKQNEKKQIIKSIKGLGSFMFACLVVLIVLSVVTARGPRSGITTGISGLILGAAFCQYYVTVPCMIIDLVKLRKTNKAVLQLEDEYKEYMMNCETIYQMPKKPDLEDYDLEVDKLYESINENNIIISQCRNEIKEKNKEAAYEIKEISEKGLELYNLLVPEFSSMLDQRDWENVDLIIYLLETGRAETMKEALQQVDTYSHTDRIVGALVSASHSISLTIRENIQDLKYTVAKCADELGKKIDRVTYNVSVLSDKQSEISNELHIVNERMEKTNLSIEMQNALLEKSNVSSAKMAENVEKMRTYADEAYIKNVNKW